MKIKVSVCELRDDPDGLARDWERLVAHVAAEKSDLVLLPEMPFYTWFGRTRPFDPAVWSAALQAHDTWETRLAELAPAIVLGSRPVERAGRRLNEGYVWSADEGYRTAHHKYYLPDEPDYWEASWYQHGEADFTLIYTGEMALGFLICTEMWFMHRARQYGKAGASLIVTPRTTGRDTVDKWLAGGRAAAVVAGAFGLSSNRNGLEGETPAFGGQGWVIDPDGNILGLTSTQKPFLTVEIDLSEAELAKTTYPRYVPK